MREILYKAKTTLPGMNNMWVFGSLIHITETYKGEEDSQDCDIWQIVNEEGVAFDIDPNTICQYIGHNDALKQKIFENDILEGYSKELYGQQMELYYPTKGESQKLLYKINQNISGWEMRCIKYPKKHTSLIFTCNYKVIGNTIDNSELLIK